MQDILQRCQAERRNFIFILLDLDFDQSYRSLFWQEHGDTLTVLRTAAPEPVTTVAVLLPIPTAPDGRSTATRWALPLVL